MTPIRAFTIGLILGFGFGGAIEAYRHAGILANVGAMAVFVVVWGAYPFLRRWQRTDESHRVRFYNEPDDFNP